MALTAIQVKEAKSHDKDLKISDGGGMYLLVKVNASKYWRMDYRFAGKRRTYAIGVYPQVTLKEARERRYEAKSQLSKGIDPNEAKKERNQHSGVPSFEELAYKWWNHERDQWTTPHADRVIKRLKDNCFRDLGKLPANQITPLQVIAVIKKIEARDALDVANRVKQGVKSIYRYGIQHGVVTTNPAGDLDGIVKSRKVKHRPSLPKSELPQFLTDLDSYAVKGTLLTQLALKILVLTFVRSGELRGAKWEEFDLNNHIWRIPAGRMKMKVEHLVPLSSQAIDLLKKLSKISGSGEFVLPSVKSRSESMSDNTMRQAIFRLGYDGKTVGKSKAVPHGFRATASSILNEEGFNPDAIERQLAHQERNGVRAAYTHHARYIIERKAMMQWWADYLDELKSAIRLKHKVIK
ncbi:tyrosine-type recombinase/integrase [Porticoccaceae bacterium]|nr:tyrosine-type recombinase/integrase [Porticoccaceae bacterium]